MLLPSFRYQLNPDAVSYLSIAHHYAQGQFHEAINGYWGPMFSWLLTSFAWAGIDLQLAAKFIQLIAGLLLIVMAWKICNEVKTSKVIKYGSVSALVPLCWYWALPSPITPDLLAATIFASYIYLLIKSNAHSKRTAVLMGLCVAGGFFTKIYLLFFFMAHYSLLMLWRYLKSNSKRQIAKNYLVTLGVGFLLMAPWIALISSKYHHLTISTASSFNFNVTGPRSPGQPVHTLGLIKPADAGSISAWEDPSYLPTAHWSPLESVADLRYFIGHFFSNLSSIGRLFFDFSFLSPIILLASLYTVSRQKRDTQKTRNLALLLSAILIYVLGYATTFHEERYLWPAFLCVILLVALMARELDNSRALILIVVFFLSIAIGPLLQIERNRGTGEGLRNEALSIKPLLSSKPRIASNRFDSIDICYYLNVPCYGEINQKQNDQQISNQLKKYDINDILILKDLSSSDNRAYLDDYKQVVNRGNDLWLFQSTVAE